jgi:hypothetical protein
MGQDSELLISQRIDIEDFLGSVCPQFTNEQHEHRINNALHVLRIVHEDRMPD